MYTHGQAVQAVILQSQKPTGQRSELTVSHSIPVSFTFSSPHIPLRLRPQGPEGVPVAHGAARPVHDQLAGAASAGHHHAGGLLVPGGLDLRRVPAPGPPGGPHPRGLHPRPAAVQHVSDGPLGLHDGRRWVPCF